MAVFTPVTPAEFAPLAARLRLGEVEAMRGVEGGVENTNYFVKTSRGVWVLTLLERMQPSELDLCLPLLGHLAARGLPVPAPQADDAGRVLHTLAGKPAVVVPRLPGHHVLAPDRHHVAQVGRTLARLHLAAADFDGTTPNPRGAAWRTSIAERLAPQLDDACRALLADELDRQRAFDTSPAAAALPHAAVHADLFRDNVLFDGLPAHERLTGCIDFYFAGVDTLVYDLAVTLNDWCLGADGALDATRAADLVAAYEAERPLRPAEHRALPLALRAAALRFWLSRLADWHLPRPAALLAPKDPTHFERLLRAHRGSPWHAALDDRPSTEGADLVDLRPAGTP